MQQLTQPEGQASVRPQVERQKSGAPPAPPSQQQQQGAAPPPPKQQVDKVQSPRAAAASPVKPDAKRSVGGVATASPAAAKSSAAAEDAVAEAAAAQAVAGGDGPGSSSPKKRPHRWLEWPSKGCGMFATCISERALKNSMTLPGGWRRVVLGVLRTHMVACASCSAAWLTCDMACRQLY